jgi:hypothetical protein
MRRDGCFTKQYLQSMRTNLPNMAVAKEYVILHSSIPRFINGSKLTAPQKQRYEAFMALAAGELEEDKLAVWYRENAAKR